MTKNFSSRVILIIKKTNALVSDIIYYVFVNERSDD